MPNIKIKNKYNQEVVFNNINSVFVPNEDITKLSFYGLEGTTMPTYAWEVIAPPFPNPQPLGDNLISRGFYSIIQTTDSLEVM